MKLKMNSDTRKNIRPYRLYVMVGAPGSGKSTWALENISDAVYVSRDNIRYEHLQDGEDYFSHEKETFAIFIETIVLALIEKKVAIADATHLNLYARRKLLGAIDQQLRNQYDIYFVCMNTSCEECLRRNSKREGRAKVPDSAIKEMYDKLTKPKFEEHPSIKSIWVIEERSI